MKNFLSPRLLACCDFINPGQRVADVGCDHGYLGIYLLKQNIASYIYAGDVNEAPLQSAVHNAEKYEVSNQISFYLSDGLRNFPRDFDALVCAGMGADTMVSVLEAAPWLKNERYTLILQCQSKTHYLRQYLSEQGFRIQRERVVRDGRFLYTVMMIVYAPGLALTPGECFFSPVMESTPELPEYYEQILFRLRRALEGQKDHPDPYLATALQQLDNDPKLQWLKENHNGNC